MATSTANTITIDMFAYEFMTNAFVAAGIVAVVSGLVGYFLVMRGQTFAGHALSHIGFAGATGAEQNPSAQGKTRSRSLPKRWHTRPASRSWNIFPGKMPVCAAISLTNSLFHNRPCLNIWLSSSASV